ncbi:hypothetical protein GCM10028773_42820 [Spirosoma koreense]
MRPTAYVRDDPIGPVHYFPCFHRWKNCRNCLFPLSIHCYHFYRLGWCHFEQMNHWIRFPFHWCRELLFVPER